MQEHTGAVLQAGPQVARDPGTALCFAAMALSRGAPPAPIEMMLHRAALALLLVTAWDLPRAIAGG
jgi:hypothetical protein